jgi:hypothetical protein
MGLGPALGYRATPLGELRGQGAGGRRHPPQCRAAGQLIRLGARFVIAGTDVDYVLAGARQDTTALRAIPLG